MAHFLETWGYLAIFVLTAAEAACLPAPSEITLGLGGALAGTAVVPGSGHHLQLPLVIAAGVAGAVSGSLVAYTVGRRGGRILLDRVGRRLRVSGRDLDRVEAWFARRESVVLFGRVVPLVRTFVSLPAGMAEMPVARFVAYTAAGCAVWVTALSVAGYALGDNWRALAGGVGRVGAGLLVAALVGAAALLLHRRRSADRRTPGPGQVGAGTGPGGGAAASTAAAAPAAAACGEGARTAEGRVGPGTAGVTGGWPTRRSPSA